MVFAWITRRVTVLVSITWWRTVLSAHVTIPLGPGRTRATDNSIPREQEAGGSGITMDSGGAGDGGGLMAGGSITKKGWGTWTTIISASWSGHISAGNIWVARHRVAVIYVYNREWLGMGEDEVDNLSIRHRPLLFQEDRLEGIYPPPPADTHVRPPMCLEDKSYM